MTRAEMLNCFINHIAHAPGMAADFYAELPSEFDTDLKQIVVTPDDEWVTSFYPRGIASADDESLCDTSESSSEFDADAHALATLRAIQTLDIP